MCYHQAISNSCQILSCAVVETNKRGDFELVGLLTTHEKKKVNVLQFCSMVAAS